MADDHPQAYEDEFLGRPSSGGKTNLSYQVGQLHRSNIDGIFGISTPSTSSSSTSYTGPLASDIWETRKYVIFFAIVLGTAVVGCVFLDKLIINKHWTKHNVHTRYYAMHILLQTTHNNINQMLFPLRRHYHPTPSIQLCKSQGMWTGQPAR
jgi:hypothetical protein